MYCGGRRCTPWRSYRESGILAARTCGDGHAAGVLFVGSKYVAVVEFPAVSSDYPSSRIVVGSYDRLGAAKQAADRRLSEVCGRRKWRRR